jgi:hypothetical protein
MSANWTTTNNAGFAVLRVIFLSEQLMDLPREDALWIIGHEIAHSWLKHEQGGHDEELPPTSLLQPGASGSRARGRPSEKGTTHDRQPAHLSGNPSTRSHP